jgi:hypothetical protein
VNASIVIALEAAISALDEFEQIASVCTTRLACEDAQLTINVILEVR